MTLSPALANLPAAIPIFPLAGALLLPRGRLPLHIFEPRYLTMIDDAMRGQRVIGMVQPVNADPLPDLYPVGCLGKITSWSEGSEGRYMITLTGLVRFRIRAELQVATPYRQITAAYAAFTADHDTVEDESCVDRRRLGASLETYFKRHNMENGLQDIHEIPGEALINSLAMMCPFEIAEKQALLEAPTLAERAHLLTALIEMTAAAHGGPAGTLQ